MKNMHRLWSVMMTSTAIRSMTILPVVVPATAALNCNYKPRCGIPRNRAASSDTFWGHLKDLEIRAWTWS